MKISLRKVKTTSRMLTCLVITGSILIGSSGTSLITSAKAATNNANATTLNDADVTTISDTNKLKEFAQKNNIELEKDGKKLSEIVIKKLKPSNKISKDNITKIGLMSSSDYYISNVDSNETCDAGSKTISKVSGPGPGPLKLDINTSIPVKWHAKNVTASQVSDAVGFNVEGSTYVSGSKTIELSSGESATIYANSYVMNYTFDITYRPTFGYDIKSGTGVVEQTTGVCFSVYK